MTEPSTADIVAQYIKLRDKKKVLEQKHKDELEPIKEAMAIIEQYLGVLLHDAKEKSRNTEAGLVYISNILSVEVLNEQKFIAFANAQDPDMLNIKPSKSGVQAFLERTEGKIPIPGVKLTKIANVNIRRN
jgi:hypothetical protein